MQQPGKLYFRADGRTPAFAPPVVSGIVRPTRSPSHTGAFPSLSVVLALHGQRALTEACLRSLWSDVPEAEVICVDNASPDDTRRWLRGQPVRAVLLDENRGCAGGWNAGLAEAAGEVLCILNNDTIVHPGGMRALAQTAWGYGIAAQSGGVLSPDLQFAETTCDPDLADYPEGYALAFRRDVWEAVGPFDAGMALGYWEDTDWGLRARQQGNRWEFVSEAVTHLRGATTATLPGINTAQERNARRFRTRWSGKGVGERIEVVRGGGIGDVIMATPILAQLRRDLPMAHIYLRTPRADYFRDLAILDGVTTEPIPAATRVIDLDNSYEANREAGDWDTHICEVFAARAGVTLSSHVYLAPLTADLEDWAADLLPGGGYIACGIRSHFRPKVNWHESGWVELVRAMPLRTFVLFDGSSRPPVDAKENACCEPRLYDEPNVLDLTGKTPTERHVLALLRRCGACVSVDTGTAHLAASAGLPMVLLFGSGAPSASAPPYGQIETIAGDAPCYPCTNASKCSRVNGPHCLAHVGGLEVAASLRRVLEV